MRDQGDGANSLIRRIIARLRAPRGEGAGEEHQSAARREIEPGPHARGRPRGREPDVAPEGFTPAFDAYLAIDWSAKSTCDRPTPVADAVWAGELVVGQDGGKLGQHERFFRSRLDGMDHVRGRLVDHVAAGRRVCIGFDFAYGYPAGFAEACGFAGSAKPWRLTWDELASRIEDRPDCTNNRFQVAGELNQRFIGEKPGPFWGRPAGASYPGLAPKSPAYPYLSSGNSPLARLRLTESRLSGVQPTWKLFGAGAVGGQSLVGIPAVARLRDDPALAAVSRVWPFETGFDLPVTPPGTPSIVHVEIWPGVVNDKLDPALPIKDQAQVRAMVEWLAESDARGSLPALFARPEGLTDEQMQAAMNEEGWIVGAGLQKRARG